MLLWTILPSSNGITLFLSILIKISSLIKEFQNWWKWNFHNSSLCGSVYKAFYSDSQESLGDEGLNAIAEADLPKLETIWLTFNKITAKGLKNFVKHDWTNLKKLNLSANHFGPLGAAALAEGNFTNLLRLQIYDCSLGNEGVKNLVKNEWPCVQELHLCK